MAENEFVLPDTTTEDGKAAFETLKKDVTDVKSYRERYTPPAEGKYQFKPVEKGNLSEGHIAKTAALAAKLGLNNDLANELPNFLSAELAAAQEEALASNRPKGKAYEERVTAWQAAALADPELGGGDQAKLLAVAERSKQLLEKVFGPEVREFLDESGFGHHPSLLKGFAKLAELASEKGLITGGQPVPGGKKSTADVMWGGTTEGK